MLEGKLKIKIDNIVEKSTIHRAFLEEIEDKLGELSQYFAGLNGSEIKKLFFYLREGLSREIINYLIDRNQYIYIDRDFRSKLNQIYNKYLVDLISQVMAEDLVSLEILISRMDREILSFLKTYSEIKIIFNREDRLPNFQYRALEQIDILGLNLGELEEPILDLGCGKDYNLVRYLRDNELSAFGIDRYEFSKDYLDNISWLDYEFSSRSWGSIIAHMSFSNHFVRENLKKEGLYIEYGRKYMEILNSLKIGGKFYYTPSLEFMEKLLDKKTFELEYRPLENGYKSVSIKRLL